MKNRTAAKAREILSIEAKAVADQMRHIDSNFLEAVESIVSCKGRLIITGVGKSGLIGKKISATFSSLGIASMSAHPVDLCHGDLGMLTAGDILIVLSYSGESEELKKVVPIVKRMGVKRIIMTGRLNSAVAKQCDIAINVKIDREACPYNLAPTSSTTAALAMGDALALSVGYRKGFKEEDFARFHPGGMLGKRLLLTVGEIMRRGDENPVVNESCTVKEALFEMTRKKLGATSVVNSRGKLTGYFTDGDLRRKLQSGSSILNRKMKEIMTRNPRTIGIGASAADAANMLRSFNCDNLPVVDASGKPIGMVDERDLILEGLL